jgi:hypothetical protein
MPINGKKGIATTFVAIPNPLPISRLTNNGQTHDADHLGGEGGLRTSWSKAWRKSR